MASMRCFGLLTIGLLASGLGPQFALAGGAATAFVPGQADTSLLLGHDAQWHGRRMWPRCDLRDRLSSLPVSVRDIGTRPADADVMKEGAGSVSAPVADPNICGANGNVLGIARSGNTLYIAGSFRSVGENSGGFVPIAGRTGEPLRPFPKVAGSVYAFVPDGSGGWYIGGEFTAVAGKPRSCLAQIRADGSVSDWNPRVTGSPGYVDPPAVSAIAVLGDRVFVGGGFREIGGQPHENFGCVEATTGAALDWDLDTNAEGWVYTIAVRDSTVFVGGFFSSLGGQPRDNLAAVDGEIGAVEHWEANASASVLTLLIRQDTLLVGGEFGHIAGGSRPLLAALDIHTAQLLPFDAHASGIYLQYVPRPQVAALALAGDTLYAAGNFTRIGGQARAGLAMLNPSTGDALEWTAPYPGPQWEGFPPRLCQSIAVSAGTVYVGGWFESIGDESRPFAAALNAATGTLTAWNPKPDIAVYAMATRGDTIYLGGIFSLVGEWKHRAGLAALDLTTGMVKPWNPNPDGIVCTAVEVKGDRVFVSGDFSSIGGDPQPRSHLAALDTTRGEVTNWNPGADSDATVLLIEGDTLYVGGEFTQIGGQPRSYLAALSATTGDVLPWNPNPDWPVYALARSGSTIYVGGIFQSVSGQWRRGIAALDATTGTLTSWNPDTDSGTIKALLVSGNTIYIGGQFGRIGGQPRESIAAVDATTGEATPWYPQPTSWGSPTEIKSLALLDGTLCVGGVFGSMGGQPRICLAAVDTSTGLATDWDPDTDGYVWSLAAAGNSIYAGGGFTRAGGLPTVGLVAFSIPVERAPTPVAFALGQSIPNPTLSNATIRFELPKAASVTLAVYDLQGRRVATLLDHAPKEAGRHDVPVATASWSPGVYLYRIDSGSQSVFRKMVVMK